MPYSRALTSAGVLALAIGLTLSLLNDGGDPKDFASGMLVGISIGVFAISLVFRSTQIRGRF